MTTESDERQIIAGEWTYDPDTQKHEIGYEVIITGRVSYGVTAHANRHVMERIIADMARHQDDIGQQQQERFEWREDTLRWFSGDDDPIVLGPVGYDEEFLYSVPGWVWSEAKADECDQIVRWEAATVENVADRLYELILADFGPWGSKLFTDFSELHDVVDANEYLIQVGNEFGLHSLAHDPDFTIENAAVEIVSARLKANARHRIIELEHIH